MKKYIKIFEETYFLKVSLTLVLSIVLIVLVYFLNKNNGIEFKKPYFPTDITYARNGVTCIFPQMLSTFFYDNTITHSLSKPETNPIIFTFRDLDNEIGNLSWFDATQTITTVSVYKFLENNEKIVYIDGTSENYTAIFTIYKKTGISTYLKTVSLLGSPSSTSAMGTCR